MKKLSLFCLVLLLLGACSKNTDEDLPAGDVHAEEIDEGTKIVATYSENGVLIETLTEKFVNFGTAETPALFPLKEEHIVHVDIAKPSLLGLVTSDYDRFISIFGASNDINMDKTLPEYSANKIKAFLLLKEYVRNRHIDLYLLIRMVNDLNDMNLVTQFSNEIEMTKSRSLNSGIGQNVDINRVLSKISRSGLSVTEYCEQNTNSELSKTGALKIVHLVMQGLIKLSEVIIDLFYNSLPSVDIQSMYTAAYLHPDDLNYLNYEPIKDTFNYSERSYNMKEVYTKSNGKVISTSEVSALFSIDCNYTNKTYPGYYIPRAILRIMEPFACEGKNAVVKGVVTYEPGVSSTHTNWDGSNVPSALASMIFEVTLGNEENLRTHEIAPLFSGYNGIINSDRDHH